MNFGSGSASKAKAWRDIWGAGQGVGMMNDVLTVAEVVARLKAEYQAARGTYCRTLKYQSIGNKHDKSICGSRDTGHQS